MEGNLSLGWFAAKRLLDFSLDCTNYLSVSFSIDDSRGSKGFLHSAKSDFDLPRVSVATAVRSYAGLEAVHDKLAFTFTNLLLHFCYLSCEIKLEIIMLKNMTLTNV